MTTIVRNNDHNMRKQISEALTDAESRIDALEAASGGTGWLGITKPGNTLITSDNVFTDDPDLKFPVAANDFVAFEFFVWYQQETDAPDIKVTINGPASPTAVNWTVEYVQPSGGNVGAFVTRTAYLTSTNITTGTVATNSIGWVRISGMVQNGANAGDVTLQWAQSTSSGDDLIVLGGSSVRYLVA